MGIDPRRASEETRCSRFDSLVNSKRNGSVKRAPAPILSFCNDLSKKRPPYFAYNARSRSDMTPSIPPFQALFAGLINVRVATQSSLRAFHSA